MRRKIHMTVKQIVVKWKKEVKSGNVTAFPSGLFFMEATKVDAKAFETLAIKYNIPKEDYYIEKLGGKTTFPYSINFRL
jgi:hypothetical protein